MDDPHLPQIDDLLSKAVDEQVAEQRALRATLESVQAALDALAERIEAVERQLAERTDAEHRVQQYLAAEFSEFAVAVRKALDDLSGAVRRDLGRIPGVLADQRRAIAADVRAALADEPSGGAGPPETAEPRSLQLGEINVPERDETGEWTRDPE